MDYKEAFVDRFADVALAISMATGVRPEVVLGQTALETGYGKSVAGNNMFGVKGAGQMVTTHEDYGKGLSKTRESFRAYSNPKASFADYGKLMGNGRYGGVRTGASVKEQIAALGKSGYATDKKYASKMADIVSEIQGTKAFQSALSNHQADLIDTQVGVQDVPGNLYGIPEPNYGVPVADLPASPYGVTDINDYSFAAPDTPDVMSQMPGPDYSDLSASMYGNYNAPDVPSTPDPMSTMDGPTYPEMSAGLYDGAAPASDVSVPSPPDVGGLSGLDAYGPAMSEAGWSAPSHTGFDAGSFQTPDFNAPSLAEQRAFQGVSDPITSYSYDSFAHGVNADLMGELSPSSMRNTNTPSFDTVSVPEHYTSLETRTREVPFSAPNALQDAVMGDWEDKLGPAKPAMASKPQTRIETYQVPVEKTRMVQQQVPKALPSLPEVEVPAAPALSSSFASAPPGLSDQFGMGLHGFEGFLGAMNARDPAAMNAINDAGMGYAANYAMGDGPFATMGTNDLMDKFGSQFGMDARKGLAEGFKQDYGQLSPTARGGIEGAMKGLAMGGPLGMLGGGALGALGGYAMPNGFSGLFGSMFDGTFGSGLETGTPGNMSNYGTPYDGAGLSMPQDAHMGSLAEAQAFADSQNGSLFGGGGSFGGDPSQDGGSRYSGW